MKKYLKKSVAVFLSGLVAVLATTVPASVSAKKSDDSKVDYVEGEAIVVLKDSASSEFTKQKKASVVYGSGVKLKNTYSFSKKSGDFRVAVLKSTTLTTKQILSNLRKNTEIKYAFPNYKSKITSITNDAYSDFQWALENKGQNNGTKGIDVKADTLWYKASKSEEEKVVAVIDTGIDYTSEEFKDILWKNPYGSKLVGTCGADFSGTIADRKPYDDNGHGTHVAGIIAGKSDNEIGISGINKSNVKIMAVKAFDSEGYGYDDSILACFEYIERAIELGTKVSAINCSFGSYGDEYMKAFYDELFDTLGSKGVITCVASGNESTDLNGATDPESQFYDDGYYSLPACSDSIYCINVTAGTEKGGIASFANYGDKYVDVVAPGTNILSTVSYNCFNPTIYDESEREKLCASYQSFDEELKSTDFGYPTMITKIGNPYTLSQKLKFEQSDSFFGLSGKSLNISIDNKKAGKYEIYAFEIPFTINEEDKNYSISFMGSSSSETEGIVFDVPFDYDTSNIMNDIEDEYQDCYFSGEDCWSHVVYNVNTSSAEYEKSKERKLVFILYGQGDFTIDDLAISSQSVSSDAFGKYDFYSGTSMATPFVTGAVTLIENAYPEATPLEVINIIKNSGRVSAELQGKVKNGRCLSLDTTDKLSPMIIKADYNDEGNIEVTGLFSDITSVSVNGKKAEIVSQDYDKIIFKDNGYSTYTVKIKVENANGNDELETLLINKKSVEKTDKVSGVPYDTSTALMVPAGDKAYFIDTYYATIGVLNTNSPKQSYSFTDEMYTIDLQSFFGSGPYTITSAVYYNYKIYFTAVNSITTSDQSYVLGYETMLGYYDLNRGRTRKFCTLPDECLSGSSLAVLNDSLYLIGGYDVNELSYIDSMYEFNFTDNVFEKTEYNLPEARAYTSFIQYNDKLVGFYGAVESGEMPPAIVFDGSGWKTSSISLESTDCDTLVYSSEKVVKNYYGNLGIDKDGVFCNGSFVQGLGDTFTYDVENDKIIESELCYRKNLSDARLVGTTVPGAFVGFNVIEIPEYDYDDDYDFWSSSISSYYYTPDYYPSFSTSTVYSYLIELDNTSHYPSVPTEPVTEPAATVPTSASPKLTATSVSLKAGATKTLSVTSGTVKSWSTSKKSVANVSNGKITALNKGTATITATLSNGQKLTCKVNVTSSPTIKVGNKKFVKTKKYPIKKNKTLKIKISGKASSVNNVYKTSNKKVAKVISKTSSKTVKIKALKKGNAKITIKVNGVAFKVKIKVK